MSSVDLPTPGLEGTFFPVLPHQCLPTPHARHATPRRRFPLLWSWGEAAWPPA
jgi:hypothetical protein